MTANRTLLLMGSSLALILVFYILREHWGHVLGSPLPDTVGLPTDTPVSSTWRSPPQGSPVVTYQRSASSTVALSALAERVFELLFNPAFLGAHMEEPSVMMLGASMKYDLDEAEGRAIGSVIRMRGPILGRRSPWRKS